jgi:hypothetical protein
MFSSHVPIGNWYASEAVGETRVGEVEPRYGSNDVRKKAVVEKDRYITKTFGKT